MSSSRPHPGDVLKLSSPRGVPRGAPAVTRFAWSTDAAAIAAARAYIAARPGVAINPAGVGVWDAQLAAPVEGVVAGDIVQFDRRSSAGAAVVNSSFSDAYDSCFRLQASGAYVAGNTWLRVPGGVSVVYDPSWLEGSSDITDVALVGNHFRAVHYPPATTIAQIFFVDPTAVNVTQHDNTVTAT